HFGTEAERYRQTIGNGRYEPDDSTVKLGIDEQLGGIERDLTNLRKPTGPIVTIVKLDAGGFRGHGIGHDVVARQHDFRTQKEPGTEHALTDHDSTDGATKSERPFDDRDRNALVTRLDDGHQRPSSLKEANPFSAGDYMGDQA